MKTHRKAQSDGSKISKRDGQGRSTEWGYTGNWRVKGEQGRRREVKRKESNVLLECEKKSLVIPHRFVPWVFLRLM